MHRMLQHRAGCQATGSSAPCGNALAASHCGSSHTAANTTASRATVIYAMFHNDIVNIVPESSKPPEAVGTDSSKLHCPQVPNTCRVRPRLCMGLCGHADDKRQSLKYTRRRVQRLPPQNRDESSASSTCMHTLATPSGHLLPPKRPVYQ